MNFYNIPYEIIDCDSVYNNFFDQVLTNNTDSINKFKEVINIYGIGLIYTIAVLIHYPRTKTIYKKAYSYLPTI